MDKKNTGIVAYITWIGLIIAFFAGDKEGAKFHINQALVIWLAWLIVPVVNFIFGILGFIPFLGGIFSFVGGLISFALGVFLVVCFVLGLIAACKEEEKEVPILGKFKILK